MNKDLTKLGANIRNYIHLNKELVLEGVGRLCMMTKSSSITAGGTWITPGDCVLTLLPDSENIASTPQEFRGFAAELVYSLEAESVFKVPGLGLFRKSIGGTEFLEEVKTKASLGLPTLSLVPLAATASKEVAKVSTAVKRQSNTSDRKFLLGTAAAAAVFLLCLFAFHHIYGIENSSKHEISQLGMDIDNSRLNTSPESVLIRENLEPEYIPGIVEDKEVAKCALIVGSFSRQANARDMQQKILDAGYDLFTEEFHEFYRVGISVDCSDLKGATFHEIENTLGIDPWLRITY